MKFDLIILVSLSSLLIFTVDSSKLFKSEESLKSLSGSYSRSILSLNNDVFNKAKQAIKTGSRSNLKTKNLNFAKLFSFKSGYEKTMSKSQTDAILSKINLNMPCNPPNPSRREDNSCPNILTGWIKFLEISDSLPRVPSNFIKNNEFFLQQSQNQSMNISVKDNYGYINIPNEDYFYFELNKQQLKVFTARTPKYRKLDRFLNLNDLIHESSINPCKGGVEDVGNFAEGYCFMLKFTHFSRYYVWELCTDTSFEKDKWMTTMARLNQMNHMNQQAPLYNDMSLDNPQNNQGSYHGVSQVSSSITTSILTPVVPVPHVAIGLRNAIPLPIAGSAAITPPVLPGHSLGTIVSTPQGPITSNTIITSNGNAITISTHHGPGWVPDGTWGPCSEPCGPGIQRRHLKCVLDDGCGGDDYEEKMCKLKECKKDLDEHLNKLKQVAECGQWKLLGEWGPCNKPCGGGVQFRKRECIPSTKPCIGKPEISQPCNVQACKPDEFDCKQIEGQLDYIMEMGRKPVPVHLIININELAIQQDPTLAPLVQIPLSGIANLHMQRRAPGCFSLVNNVQNDKPYELCCGHREECKFNVLT